MIPCCCQDCGDVHLTYAEAIACDHRLGRHNGDAQDTCPICIEGFWVVLAQGFR